MAKKKMIIGMILGNYGSQPGAWRMPWVDPQSYTSYDAHVRYAQAAERGKLHFVFLPDGPGAVMADIETASSEFNLDVMMTLAAVARETKRIGLIATGSTTFNEPFNLARQFKALDIMSHGRAGWNAITSSGHDVAANYGVSLPSSRERYDRAYEVIQTVQALWGSWKKDAWIHNQSTGQFAIADRISPLNRPGKYVASRGPLYIPPSEQGQPVIVHAGGSENAFEIAGRYANALIGAAFTLEDAREQRNILREVAKKAGRNPNEVKFIAGLVTTLASDKRTALNRRISLTETKVTQQVAYLQQMLGIYLNIDHLDKPLSKEQLLSAKPSRRDPRSEYALKIAKEGWSLRDIIAHGIIDYHPAIVGTPEEAADHMQSWFEAGAVDGFWLCPDVFEDGINAFVDGVVPILQNRGLFHEDYEGATLRDHFGIPLQYGLDHRI